GQDPAADVGGDGLDAGPDLLRYAARLIQQHQDVAAVDAMEGVTVTLGGLAAEADDLTVVEFPLVGLRHPAGHRVLASLGVGVMPEDLLPDDLVALRVGRCGVSAPDRRSAPPDVQRLIGYGRAVDIALVVRA